jgi:hypothetical protein
MSIYESVPREQHSLGYTPRDVYAVACVSGRKNVHLALVTDTKRPRRWEVVKCVVQATCRQRILRRNLL